MRRSMHPPLQRILLPEKKAMAQLWFVSLSNLAVLWFLLRPFPCRCQFIKTPAFVEDDIRCLNVTKGELKDQYESLFTWRFGNLSQGYICSFVGVQCWHNDDSKVLSVKLPGMTLKGRFPEGLKYCGSMTALDLSSNDLSGPIPKDLCKWLPFLVSIDLSSNQFTGSIPKELYNCNYLNVLRLNDNRLSGSIPSELALLERLKDFNFANNMLSGNIPMKWAESSTDSFSNNKGLCGKPLSKSCPTNAGLGQESQSYAETTATFIGGLGVFAAGMVGVCSFGFAVWWWFIRLGRKKWARRIMSIRISQRAKNEIFRL